MPSFDGFLDLPPRPGKPRTEGLTHVIDKGLNLRDIEGLFDTAGDYVDVVKLGWGTSYVTRNLEKKIALYRSFDTPVVCGGTLFEAVVARGKLEEELFGLLNETGIGPMGLGGDVTVLQCHIEHADTHMTLNPVAVNYQCWAARRASAHIGPDGTVEYDREF